MRLPRQKPEGPSVFHCRSHLVPEVPYLIPLEKHSFTRRFRRLAAFHDMTVLTHSVMSNHFHILVRSPRKVRLTHAQLLKKLRRFYGPRSREVLEFEHALRGHPQLLATLRARYLARIGDLSVFMKELKEGFSRWYNRRHDPGYRSRRQALQKKASEHQCVPAQRRDSLPTNHGTADLTW